MDAEKQKTSGRPYQLNKGVNDLAIAKNLESKHLAEVTENSDSLATESTLNFRE